MKLNILTALNAERAARRAAIVVTDVASGDQRLVKAADIGKDPLRAALAEGLRTGKSGMAETPMGRIFLTVYVPAPQLVITGAVHISQALAPMGQIRHCRRSTATATRRLWRSPMIRRSTTRRCCTRFRAIASISARWVRGRLTPAASSGSRNRPTPISLG